MRKVLLKQIVFIVVSILIMSQSCSGASKRDPGKLDAIIHKMDTTYDAEIAVTVPGAVVLFIKDGEVYYHRAFGYSNLENKVRMAPDAVFQVASISKSVSAIGVMKLVEDGYINLDDPVEEYLSRWHIPDSAYNAQGVTFRRLLSHTAGISDTIMTAGYPPEIGLPPIEQELMGNVGSIYEEHYSFPVTLEAAPGQKWKYSNGGYGILDLAVEEIRKLSFSEYMRFYIMEPMNMLNSSYRYYSDLDEKLASSYLHVVIEASRAILSNEAAVGLYSTAGDLAGLLIEMMKCYHGEPNDFVLNRDTLLLMLEPQADIESNMYESMGLGFFIHGEGNKPKVYGHSGSVRGWRAHYEFCPDTKDGVIILANGIKGDGIIIKRVLIDWRDYLGFDMKNAGFVFPLMDSTSFSLPD